MVPPVSGLALSQTHRRPTKSAFKGALRARSGPTLTTGRPLSRAWCARLSVPWLGDEVDELLHTRQERRLQVGVGAHRREDATPGLGEVRRRGCRPTQVLADALFPGGPSGDLRPRPQA